MWKAGSSLPPRTSVRLPCPRSILIAIQLLQPSVLMTLGKPQKEALHFDAAAGDEQRMKPPRAEIAEPFYQNLDLMKVSRCGTSSSNSRIARSGGDIVGGHPHCPHGWRM